MGIRSDEGQITGADIRRAVPLFLLLYVWVRALTADPIGPYSLSLYQPLPADLLAALALAGISLLLISRKYIRWAIILGSQFLIAVTILPSLQTKFLHLTTDAYMHIGRVNRILETGLSAETNLYPFMHWLSAMVAEVTGFSSTQTAITLTVAFSAGFGLVSILCIGRLGLPKAVFPLGVFAVVLMALNLDLYNFASWAQLGRFLIIFTIFVLVISPNKQLISQKWQHILSLLLIALVFTHPLAWMMMTGILVVITVYQFQIDPSPYPAVQRPLLLSAPAAIFAWWMLNAPTFGNTLSSIVASIFLQSGDSSRLAQRTGQLSEANIEPIDIAIEFIGSYGYIVTFLGLLLVLIALRAILVRGRSHQVQPFAIGAVALWVSGVLMFALPVPFGPGRFWGVAIYLGVFVAVSDLTDIIEWRPNATPRVLALALVGLLVVYTIAAPTLYGSQLARTPNEQMTKAEYSGGEWLFEYDNEERPIQSIGVNVRNLIAYQQTTDSYRSGTKPAPHFQEMRDGSYSGYVIIAPQAGLTYPAYYGKYPEVWDYTPEDYQWLENASSARVYNSGDTSVYIIADGYQ